VVCPWKQPEDRAVPFSFAGGRHRSRGSTAPLAWLEMEAAQRGDRIACFVVNSIPKTSIKKKIRPRGGTFSTQGVNMMTSAIFIDNA
jgi:hypothetical protein